MKKYNNSSSFGSSSSWIIAVLCILLILAFVFIFHGANSMSNNNNNSVTNMNPQYQNPYDTVMMASPPPPPPPPAFMFQGNGQMWPPNVLGNPYAAPLRDERYLVGPPVVPINVPTNPGYVETSYRQMGVLSPAGGKSNDDLLILMGRPLYTNRDQWQYYAISNQRNGVKLPLTVSGKNATNEYGVKEIYDGTTVTVNGYNKPYRVGMYESDTIKYLPYV